MKRWWQGTVGLLLMGGLVACGGPRPTPFPTPTAGTVYPITTPTATATPEPPLIVEWPLPNSALGSPLLVRGRVAVTPPEGRLVAQLFDAQNTMLAQAPIPVVGTVGGPGTFSTNFEFSVPPVLSGTVRLDVLDLNADGTQLRAIAQIPLVQGAGAVAPAVEVPAPGARTTLPLHILASVGRPGEPVQVALLWQDGTRLESGAVPLAMPDGRGVVITSLDWNSESQPPQPPTQPAMVEIRDAAGALLAQQAVTMLGVTDPETRLVTVYWTLGENLQPIQVRIPRTQSIGRAALEELLWGPTPGNLAGFETAIPRPDEILQVASQAGPNWGPRVQLRSLKIVDGVAIADFSRELNLWSVGGGYAGVSIRMELLRQQITQTLLQFPTIQEVQITVEGQPL